MRKYDITILLFAAMMTIAACGNAETAGTSADTTAVKQTDSYLTEEAGYQAADGNPAAEDESHAIKETDNGEAELSPEQSTSAEEPGAADKPAASQNTTAKPETSSESQASQTYTTIQPQTTAAKQAPATETATQPTTTQPPAATQVPTTKQQPTTTQAPTTKQQPATTQAPTTKQQPTTTQAPTTTQQPTTASNPSSERDAFIDEVIRLINVERAKESLNPVAKSSALTEAAQVRAQECVQLFSHTRPNGEDCFSIISEMGYSARSLGENIAAGQQTPDAVMEAWMNSSGHRANILNPDFTEVGIGYYYTTNSTYKYYWTQMFAGGLTKN